MRARVLPFIAVLLLACLPAVAMGGPPEARGSVQCGTISTSNGGQARFINTYRMKCETARKIARKAKGAKYKALAGKFTCRPKRTEGISGLSYFCRNRGTTRSLGFIYRAP